jgi:hypothetical protein
MNEMAELADRLTALAQVWKLRNIAKAPSHDKL